MHIPKAILTLGILSISHSSFASGAEPIRVIVKYKQPPSAIRTLQHSAASTAGLPIDKIQPMAGGAYTLVFTPQSIRSVLPNKQDPTTALLNKLKSDPNVVYAVEDRKGHLKPLPKGPEPTEIVSISHDVQWDEFERPGGVMLETLPYLRDGAWAYTSGLTNPSTVVAVLDTGITEHESLSRNLLRDESGKLWGWNFAANNSDLSDETESFHGTHVSGTIAGYGERVKGMGEDLKILTLKIPDASGMFYESAVINAIHWAVGNHVPGIPDNPYPAKVLNMSFGVDEKPGKEIDHCDAALQEALWAARQRGAVVVVAAGNDNRWEHFNAPAVCNGTIKVASTGPKGTRAYYSNYGPSVTFAAPGGDLSSGNKADGILSTVHPNGGYNGSGYDFYQGTSMASPHVAGVAALVYATSNSSLSPEQV